MADSSNLEFVVCPYPDVCAYLGEFNAHGLRRHLALRHASTPEDEIRRLLEELREARQ